LEILVCIAPEILSCFVPWYCWWISIVCILVWVWSCFVKATSIVFRYNYFFICAECTL